MSSEQHPIRSAATVILWRGGDLGPEVLMGQRGAEAAFMPSKYVFPGGGVDAADHDWPLDPGWIGPECLRRLEMHPSLAVPTHALVGAAAREMAEETGLMLCPLAPATFRFVFRAITPPGRTRRFDARFFLAPIEAAKGDRAGFSQASGELSNLHWIALSAARGLDLPFITEVVLAEVAALLADECQAGVPFFDNTGSVPTFRRLR